MKKIILYIFAILIGFTSCDLDTNPTDKMGTADLPKTVDGCMAALNGVYRGFYTTQYSTGYATENFGPASVNICSDVMGEDMFEREPGSFWFTYDHVYWVRTEINNTSDRPYTWWNMYYQFINNANIVIEAVKTAEGSDALRNNVRGQALALRAYAYFNLAQWYQRTYVGNEEAPGVPLYVEPSTIATKGKPRGKLKDVYTQINSDLEEAIESFKNGSGQTHKSHIDLYVAYGLQSRVALVQENFDLAATAAAEALKKDGMTLMNRGDLTNGFNSVGTSEWMWGSEIIESQATSWYSFFCHMDAAADAHASSCHKVVSKWLYSMIDDSDIRKQWFAPITGLSLKDEDEAISDNLLEPGMVSLNQRKFRVKAKGSWAADYIYMRGAEMVLNQAEALIRKAAPDYATARTLLNDLISARYENPDKYTEYLSSLTDDNTLTLKSAESTDVVTLLDEIILQRRIELWGEGFRRHDIARLNTGFIRVVPGENNMKPFLSSSISGASLFNLDPVAKSWELVMMIPTAEFDGNPAMDRNTDQNP